MNSKTKIEEVERIIAVYRNYANKLEKWSDKNIGNQLIYIERFQKLTKMIRSNKINFKNKQILDIGCAGGNLIPLLKRFGVGEENICGIDIREERIKEAKIHFPSSKFKLMDASKMNFKENSFDCVVTFTLFSSILSKSIRKQISNEILRVLKPKGYVLYYDSRYNNPFNKDVLKMNINDINYIFPSMEKYLRPITVLPPIIRRLGAFSQNIYPTLSKIKILNTHYMGLFRK